MATAQISQPVHRPSIPDRLNMSSTTSSFRRTSLSSFPNSGSPSRLPRSPMPFSAGPARISDPTSSTESHTSSLPGTISPRSSASNSITAPANQSNIRSPRRLRSQYPRNDPESHVEYILVASFDIDRGPIMEYQYPVSITGDENMLAALMLPDQAHVRNQDWTMFFLHKDTSSEEEEANTATERRRRRRQRRRDIAAGLINPGEDNDEAQDEEDDLHDSDDESSASSTAEGGEGPPLIYVLNLVNTKQDKTVKRGAVVKAMAVCTRHPFLHIYKPLLLLALEEYFKNPHLSTLASLYESVNNMDLSLMPKLTLLERSLLQASNNKDLFVEKFEQLVQLRIEEDSVEREKATGMAKTIQKRPDLTRTGTKAHIEHHSDYAVPRDTHEFETRVVYNGIPVPIKVPVAVSPETVGDFSLVKIIQTFADPHTKAPQPFSLHPHLTTGGAYTHPIIVLANAMLTQKRVIFLGHNRPSGDVAEAVLAACALASGGILRGFTRHAFPYTELSKIDDLLKVPGFVAGVTNPTFEHHPEWWDLLCDLSTGRMRISSRIDAAPITEGLTYFQQQHPIHVIATSVATSTTPSTSDPTGDAAFMNEVLRAIAARHGEGVIRAKWRGWVEKFTRVSAAFEESVYGVTALYIGSDETVSTAPGVNGHGYVWPDELSKQRELAGGVNRIEGWRNTRSYYSFIQDLAQLYTCRPLKDMDLHHFHDRLRTQKLTPVASGEIYLALARHINTYDEICQLLSVAPESQAGLFYIALGLFHKDKVVRLRVVELLDRVSQHEAGSHWWNALSRFEQLAFIRIKGDAEAESRTGKQSSRDGQRESPDEMSGSARYS